MNYKERCANVNMISQALVECFVGNDHLKGFSLVSFMLSGICTCGRDQVACECVI